MQADHKLYINQDVNTRCVRDGLLLPGKFILYSKTCVKQPLKNRQNKGLKGIYYCLIEVIKVLTDKGQFQYYIKLKGPQVGIYLYTLQFLSLRK